MQMYLGFTKYIYFFMVRKRWKVIYGIIKGSEFSGCPQGWRRLWGKD